MVLIEAIEASGNDPMIIGGESTTLKIPKYEEGHVIEFPRFDPMKLTREEWLNLPDARSKMDALVSLRRRSYKPEYADKAQEIFPEGYSVPLSEIEKRVFSAMIQVMAPEDEIDPGNKHVLAEHLHEISADDAIEILRKEAEAKNKYNNFWYMSYDIGGYELNRLIAKEIEDRVLVEQKRDEIKMRSLIDMSFALESQGIPMYEQDHLELERLRSDYEERQEASRQYWEKEREKGYQSLRPL